MTAAAVAAAAAMWQAVATRVTAACVTLAVRLTAAGVFLNCNEQFSCGGVVCGVVTFVDVGGHWNGHVLKRKTPYGIADLRWTGGLQGGLGSRFCGVVCVAAVVREMLW